MANETSVWALFGGVDETNGQGFFIRNSDFNDSPRALKFIDMEWREQRESTPDVFKTEDGRELLVSFEEIINGAVVKRAYTAKSLKNSLLIAMKDAGVEIGDIFEATRQGEGVLTRFTVRKLEKS